MISDEGEAPREAMPLFLGVPGMARFLQVEVLPRVFTRSKTLAYDAIGNPTSDGTWTYAWQAGRQLKSMSKSGTSVTYKYDHNGLRVQKVETSGTKVTTTAYTLNGNRVVYAKVTEKTDGTTTATNTMYFYYDAQGRPAKVNFNGTMYTYIHNLQGDIVGMLDRSGALVVD